MGLLLSYAAASRIGPRPRNEDVVVLPGPGSAAEASGTAEATMTVEAPLLFAVVDGMGGQAGGGSASRTVAEGLAAAALCEPLGESVSAALVAANARLYAMMDADPALTGMGATVAGVVVTPEAAVVFNVGDARVYGHGGGFSVLLSTDDRRAPDSAVVTQSLGGATRPTAVAPHLAHAPLADGARLLICSDGVSDPLTFDALQEALQGPSPAAAVGALLAAVAAAGARDNTSLIVLDVRTTSEDGEEGAR